MCTALSLGWKVGILLEELGVPYDAHVVNIGAGDQFSAGDSRAPSFAYYMRQLCMWLAAVSRMHPLPVARPLKSSSD